VFAGESGDGIPLSMWEQLAGMFEARAPAPCAPARRDRSPSAQETQGAPEEPPPLAPLPRLQLPAFFESEHLDVDLPFDGGMGAPPAQNRPIASSPAPQPWTTGAPWRCPPPPPPRR